MVGKAVNYRFEKNLKQISEYLLYPCHPRSIR